MADAAADIKSGRLGKDQLDRNFSDLHEPLSRPEALIEADRCYFCYDAPCTTACPTGIDIPAFIQKIRSDNVEGSAHTILRENIMGGMCARVCPTEVLCEEACVRNTHEDKPVEIGLLQRYATDPVLDAGKQLFERAPVTGKTIAVVGAGPAGLSCAHRLSMAGHDVVIFERDTKAGGLNEYGIAAYKTIDNFAQREVEYILAIGGIEIRYGVTLGRDVTLDELQNDYDAVFLGIGLGDVNKLDINGADDTALHNAVHYIADLRQADQLGDLPVGRNIVVIGGGMTAIDIAVQNKRLGAERVDIVYRRGPEQMGASQYEQDLAKTDGVVIHHWAMPKRVHGGGKKTVEFARTTPTETGRLEDTGEAFELTADVVFQAIGQRLAGDGLVDEIHRDGGKIVVDDHQATSLPGVWAGGDCACGGDDLTVTAVHHGKLAAIAIDEALRGQDG